MTDASDPIPPPAPGTADERGFTLLELLVVIAILGMLAAIVAPQVLRYMGTSRSETAKVQIRNIASALELYRLDNIGYPSTADGLQALVKQPGDAPSWNGPYLPQASALNDPWGHPYLYKVPGDHGEIDVYTFGSDNVQGGTGEAKDVGNW